MTTQNDDTAELRRKRKAFLGKIERRRNQIDRAHKQLAFLRIELVIVETRLEERKKP